MIITDRFLSHPSIKHFDEKIASLGHSGIACGIASWTLNISIIHVLAYKIIAASVKQYTQSLLHHNSIRLDEAIRDTFAFDTREEQMRIRNITGLALQGFSQGFGWLLGSYIMELCRVKITIIETGLLFMLLPICNNAVDTMIC